MAAQELLDSRETNRRLDRKHTHRRRYYSNASNEAAAVAEVIAVAPPVVIVDSKTLRIIDIRLEETDSSNTRYATVNWATKDSPQSKTATQPTETNDYEESFSIGGTTQTIQEAHSQSKYGTNATDVGNAINVQDDGSVAEIDVIIPQLTFSSTHYLPDSTVTDAYVRGLRSAVGKTNSDVFRGYSVGELLLLSADGSKRGEDDWRITFDFLAGENLTGQTVAGVSGIDKAAHDYLWVQYEQDEDATANKMKPTAVGVYVATVYKSIGFAATLKI